MMQNVFDSVLFIVGSPALMVLLKTTFIVALGLALVWFASAARAAVRHLLFVCTFVALFVVPPASFIVPAFQIEIESPRSADVANPTNPAAVLQTPFMRADTAVTATPTFESRLPSLKTLAWLVWGLGATLLLLKLTVSLLRLRRLRQQALPCLEITGELQALVAGSGIRRKIDVLLHDKIEVPFTYGLVRPAILLPNDATNWSEIDRSRVLVHELEHIKRGDWIVQLMARSVCACYWFQPLVWIAWRRMCLEAERACDDAVVIQTEHTDYAEQLVSLARRLSGTLAPPVPSMANRSDLSHRVTSILNANQARGRAGLRWTMIAVVCSAVVILAVAPGLAVSQTQKQSRTKTVTLIADVVENNAADAKTQALNEALIQAAESGKLGDIEQLISSGAQVNGVVDGDGTALIVAAREGNIDAVSLLLKYGADVNKAAAGDGNPLIMAAREGHEDVVQLLLDRGALVNQVVEGDENALIQAAGSGRLGVVKLLINRGADVNARVWSGTPNGEWRSPLSMAKRHGHKDVVELLLSLGARE
jgi:beta-lactamase regulating signal transducer with metallopeptidase domain